MAITFIQPITQPLYKSINYILNPAKTENRHWTQAYNCPSHPKGAYRHMRGTKERYGKPGGVQGHMMYFSFAPGEVSEQKAFDIVNAFAMRYLNGKYETVLAIHNDKDHIHGHIVFNSVSFADGKKYHSNAKEYYGQIRRIADELCRENGLSVVVPGADKTTKHYIEYQMEKRGFKTWKELARNDVDLAIGQAYSFSNFLIALENMGYTVNNDPNRKHVTIQPHGMTSRIRLATLGSGYSEQTIKARIAERLNHYEPQPRTKRKSRRVRARYSRDFLRGYKGKITGFQAAYLRYLYMLGKVGKAARMKKRHYPMRRDVANLEKHLAAYRFITAHKLESRAKVEQLQAAYETRLQAIKRETEEIRQTENPLRYDFRLLAEYERLKPAYALYQKGHRHVEEVAADFLAARAKLQNRGYESEEKIKTLSQTKADIYEHKEQTKENQRQVRAVLKDCKNVLQSYETMNQTRQEEKEIQREEAQKQERKKAKAHGKEKTF